MIFALVPKDKLDFGKEGLWGYGEEYPKVPGRETNMCGGQEGGRDADGPFTSSM